MVKYRFSVSSIPCFLCCIFLSSFFVKTLVSQPFPRPDQIEILLAFKNEFSNPKCNFTEWPYSKPVTKSWTNKNVSSFDGVVFDNKTGVVTKLNLHGACLNGNLNSNSSLFRFQHLRYLDLSLNHFDSSSFLAELAKLTNLEVLVLSKTGLVGEIPISLCNQTNLRVLDLSHNNFTGSIPGCLSKSKELLNLRNNNLIGSLPDIFDKNASLKILDVGHNQITGKLPSSLANCTRLTVLDMGSNSITDTFPFWLNDLPKLKFIDLRSNKFHGPIYSPNQHPLSFQELRVIDISRNNFNGTLPSNYFVNWSSMYMTNEGLNYTAIDFSGNKLEGEIPESIGLLKSLIALNLSNNDFNGLIPSSLAKLKNLESLDLSRNQLSGNIPQELGKLSYLAYINMSHNKLSGQIPQGTQFQSQAESSFEGNIDLCGFPLQKICSKEKGTPSKQEHVLNSKAAATIGYYRPNLIMFGLVIVHVMWFITLFHF